MLSSDGKSLITLSLYLNPCTLFSLTTSIIILEYMENRILRICVVDSLDKLLTSCCVMLSKKIRERRKFGLITCFVFSGGNVAVFPIKLSTSLINFLSTVKTGSKYDLNGPKYDFGTKS